MKMLYEERGRLASRRRMDRYARRKARAVKYRLRLRRLIVLTALLFAGIGLYLLLAPAEDPEPMATVVQPDLSSPPSLPDSPAGPERSEPPIQPGEPAMDPAALEARIGEIAAYYGGTYGVVIHDPTSGERVSLGADDTFFAASIGKLPTLLSLYESAATGEVDLNDEISIYPSEVQSYGTGILHNWPIGSTLTLRECAYYLMNQSDNTAWVMLTRYLGLDEIQADLWNIGANDTAYWDPNTTTASDVLLMLEKVTDPSFTSPELYQEVLASMTGTDFEDRIPAGLPPDVRVAHKIGSYESSFSDAGIVFHKGPDGNERHYFIVVLTAGVGETTARVAIQEISAAAHRTFAPRR